MTHGVHKERGAMRILIAEDELVPRRVLERTLQGWGYEVVTTT